MQVEQRHRDAVADWHWRYADRSLCDPMKAGMLDGNTLVQAFTRFEASLPPSAPVDAGGGDKGLREALQGLLTLVDGCLTAEMIAEGMHAGLRKGSDAPDAAALWRAIADSKTSAWSDAARFAVDPFFTMWGKKALDDARTILATPSVLAESTSNDCLLVAEAVRERCVEAAEKMVRFDRKNGDEQQRARADAFQAGQRHAAQEIRSLDLSGVGVG